MTNSLAGAAAVNTARAVQQHYPREASLAHINGEDAPGYEALGFRPRHGRTPIPKAERREDPQRPSIRAAGADRKILPAASGPRCDRVPLDRYDQEDPIEQPLVLRQRKAAVAQAPPCGMQTLDSGNQTTLEECLVCRPGPRNGSGGLQTTSFIGCSDKERV